MKHSVIILDPGLAWEEWPAITAKLEFHTRSLLQTLRLLVLRAASLEGVRRQIGNSKPGLVIVPICKWAVEVVHAIRQWFPKATIAMVYPDKDATAGFDAHADTILDVAKIEGVKLLNTTKAPAAIMELLKGIEIIGIGAILDGHRLIRKIGQGGFGTTYLAMNVKTHQMVAIKVIEGREQVKQELGALRKYVQVSGDSPYLIRVKQINGQGTVLWLITPLADSVFPMGSNSRNYRPMDLRQHLETTGQLQEKEALQIVRDLLTGLSVLHNASLLHGDVTLANILQINGRWVLADPGLVRFIGDPAKYLTKGYYPQPLTGKAPDDLHAVAVILWELVNGKDRLELDSFAREALGGSADPVERIVSKATARDSQERYPNAEAMLRDIESQLAGPVTKITE